MTNTSIPSARDLCLPNTGLEGWREGCQFSALLPLFFGLEILKKTDCQILFQIPNFSFYKDTINKR